MTRIGRNASHGVKVWIGPGSTDLRSTCEDLISRCERRTRRFRGRGDLSRTGLARSERTRRLMRNKKITAEMVRQALRKGKLADALAAARELVDLEDCTEEEGRARIVEALEEHEIETGWLPDLDEGQHDADDTAESSASDDSSLDRQLPTGTHPNARTASVPPTSAPPQGATGRAVDALVRVAVAVERVAIALEAVVPRRARSAPSRVGDKTTEPLTEATKSRVVEAVARKLKRRTG